MYLIHWSSGLLHKNATLPPIIAAAARGDGVSVTGGGATGAGGVKGEGCPGNTGREGGAMAMGNGDCIPAAAMPSIAAAAMEEGGVGNPRPPAPTGGVDVLGDPNAALAFNDEVLGVGVLVVPLSRSRPLLDKEVSESESLSSGERLAFVSLLSSSRDRSRGLGVDVSPRPPGGVPRAALGGIRCAGVGGGRKGTAPC